MEQSKLMARLAYQALDDKKGEDIQVIDISQVSVLADYFIIANGNSESQVRALVDNVEEELSKEAKYLLATEVADAGCVLFSKCDDVPEEQLEATLSYLNQTLEQVHCKRRFTLDQILCKSWEDLDEADYKRLLTCGYRMEDYEIGRASCRERV